MTTKARVLHEPAPVALVLAAMWAPELEGEFVLAQLKESFGNVSRLSPVFAFTQSDYYEGEMGTGLTKCFVELEARTPRGSLASHKIATVALERRYLADSGSRRLNVDPMLVSLENVVVASSKSFPHRVYLGQGVYGDPQLLRRKGRFEAMPWTYKDYGEQLKFFEDVHRGLPRAQS